MQHVLGRTLIFAEVLLKWHVFQNKPGGKRTVLIPAAMAYGANPPARSGIPANADLIFDIELISFK